MNPELKPAADCFCAKGYDFNFFARLGNGQYVLYNPEHNIGTGPNSCKDGLMTRLSYTAGWAPQLHNGGTDIYFKFSNYLESFQKHINDTFKLFIDQPVCDFYSASEGKDSILRLTPQHFFFSYRPLVDLFVVISRMVALKRDSFKSRVELVQYIRDNYWGNSNYGSQLIDKVINYFEEFLEILKNAECCKYLTYSFGFKWACFNLETRITVLVRDERGNNTPEKIKPPEPLLNFLKKIIDITPK